MSKFAKVLVRALAELGVTDVTFIGHSMGGAVALEIYKQAPNLVRRLVMIDTVLWPNEELRAAIGSVNDLLQQGKFDSALAASETALFLPSDPPEARALFQETYSEADKTTLAASFSAHLIDYAPTVEIGTVNEPMAFIGAEHPLSVLETLALRIPGIRLGRTIGSGHFCPFIVPNQVNAMIDGFLSTT